MELQEALKVILPQKIIDFLMGTSDVKITNCKCDLCNKNGLNGAPEPKTIIEITHRYKYTSSPHEENVYTTTSYEPTLEEAIKVLQKHLREDKSEGSYYYSWQANIAMAFYDEARRQYPETYAIDFHNVANLAAKNFLDNLIKE